MGDTPNSSAGGIPHLSSRGFLASMNGLAQSIALSLELATLGVFPRRAPRGSPSTPLIPHSWGKNKVIEGHPQTLFSVPLHLSHGSSLFAQRGILREFQTWRFVTPSRGFVPLHTPAGTRRGNTLSLSTGEYEWHGWLLRRIASLRPPLSRLWAAPGTAPATPPRPPHLPAPTGAVWSPCARSRSSHGQSWDSHPEVQNRFQPKPPGMWVGQELSPRTGHRSGLRPDQRGIDPANLPLLTRTV